MTNQKLAGDSWEIVSRPAGSTDASTIKVDNWKDYAAIQDRVVSSRRNEPVTKRDSIRHGPHGSSINEAYPTRFAGKGVTSIHADLLIPGKGQPMYDQVVISEGGKITFIGSSGSIPSKYTNTVPKKVPVLMPGLWECHAHFVGTSPNKPINAVNLVFTNPAEAGARNVRGLHDVLYAGYTSCIDLGGYAPELQRVIDEGSILGPTLYGAGSFISMTAGHGDIAELPYGSVWQKVSVSAPGTDTTSPCIIADGIEECRKAVRMNLRRGARIIKVLTSGGVASLNDNPKYQQFTDEELSTIVSEASRMGLVCAAHAIGKAGILAAVRAGFKVIEHGSYIDSEVIEIMKEKSVMLVATISPIQSIIDHPDSYPPHMYEKASKLAAAHKFAYRAAVQSGIKCALGSDLFGGPNTDLGPGLNGREVVYAVREAGMTPLQAIEAATANGPLSLGDEQAPLSGQIRLGYDADFLGLETNPLEDIGVLARPRDVKFVWKAGKMVKGPGLDSWEMLDNNWS